MTFRDLCIGTGMAFCVTLGFVMILGNLGVLK